MKTITVPDSWGEVSIRTYQELLQAEKDFERVSILIDEDPEEVKRYDPGSMGKLLTALSWTKQLPDRNRYKEFIEIDGVEYRLVSNLNGFSLGEWIDMDEYVRDFETNLHLVAAMLYRPVGEYRAEDVAARAELFRDRVNIGDIYGAFVFFSLVATKSTIAIQRYLTAKNLTQMKHLKKSGRDLRRRKRLKSGAGTGTPTIWRRGILQRWRMS